MTNDRPSIPRSVASPSALRWPGPFCVQTGTAAEMPARRSLSVFATLGLVLATLAGCDASADCEKKRLELFRAWESVHEAAYERKLAGVDEATWTKIEAKTDLLQSAFATRQVTWDSANKASGELEQLAAAANTDAQIQLEVFKTSAAEARAKQAAFFDACH